MTGTAKRDGKYERTTEVIDEFRYDIKRQNGTVAITSKRQFGDIAHQHISSCMAPLYRRYKDSLKSTFAIDSLEECVNTFYEEKKKSFKSAIDAGTIMDDKSFDGYATTAAKKWIASLFERTDRGRIRDLLRNRMSRDKEHRFVNIGNNRWGLAGGSSQPTKAQTYSLKIIALRYPIDIDPAKFADPNREKTPSYGKPGQIENMLEGVLEEADGTLTLTELSRIIQFRIPQMQVADIISLDEDPEHTMDFPDTRTTDPAEMLDVWDNEGTDMQERRRRQLQGMLADYLESLSPAQRKEKLKDLKPLTEYLLRGTIHRK